MRWRNPRKSSNIEDRRGRRVPMKAVGGGIGGLILLVIIMLLGGGGDPSAIVLSFASFQYYNATAAQITEIAKSDIRSSALIEAEGLSNSLENKIAVITSNIQVLASSRSIMNGEVSRAQSLFDGTQQLRIGANSLSSTNGFFRGNVDEVRVWNGAPTSQEVSDQYNKGVFGTSGQVLHLPFETTLAQPPMSTDKFAIMNVVTWDEPSTPIRYGALTDISIFHYVPQEDGTWKYDGTSIDIDDTIHEAHANGVRVTLTVGGWLGGDGGAFPTIWSNPALRAKSIDGIIAEMKLRNYDGIKVDVEGQFPWDDFEVWMKELSARIRSENPNWIIDWDVPPKEWNLSELDSYVDRILVMNFNGREYEPSETMPVYEAQLQDPNKLAVGLSFEYISSTSELNSKLTYADQNGYGYMFWSNLACTNEYYDTIKIHLFG
jgi:glycosyl hydrolase family 18 (putative chitinase)/putative neutral zinc metallopeptidase